MACERTKKLINDDKTEMKKNSTHGSSSCPSCNLADRHDSTSKSYSSSSSGPRSASCSIKCPAKSIHSDNDSTPSSKSGGGGSPREFSLNIKNAGCERKELRVTNPFIEKMDEDILYHIALGNKSHDLQKMFGDVKFVVMGGTPKRMEQFAYYVSSQIGYELPAGTILNDISKNSHRYAMFKVGPILSVSHGMGTPSIGILLHELIKLVSHAGVKDPTFIRIGTCGGFSKKAGTVVVSNKVVNDFMEPFYELAILRKKVRFPASLSQDVVNEIVACAEPGDKFETIAGVTYCTDNFYEGSGRADGAICEFSEQEGLTYFKELQKNGVVNVEMESLAFAALTCRAGIKSAIITVILSDRLETEQIKQPKEILDEWQTRPHKLLARFIKKKIGTVSFSHMKHASAKISDSSTAGSICQPCLNLSGKVSPSSKSSSASSSSICKPCLDLSGKSFPKESHEKHKQKTSTVCQPCNDSTKKSSSKETKKEGHGSSGCQACAESSKKSSSQETTKEIQGSPSCQPCNTSAADKKPDKAMEKTADSASSSQPIPGTVFCKKFVEKPSVSPETPKCKFQKRASSPLGSQEGTPSSADKAKCASFKCYGKQTDTPPATTPRTYQAKDFDSSSKSTLSNDSWRSCYQKCLKMPGSNTSTTSPSSASQSTATSTTWKPNIFKTPEQDKIKGFPISQLGPCCNKDANKMREVTGKETGPCCSGKELTPVPVRSIDRDASPASPNTSMERQKYIEERNNQESITTPTLKSCVKQEDSTSSTIAPKTRKASDMPGVDVKELDPSEYALGPCCNPSGPPRQPREVSPKPGLVCSARRCREEQSPEECENRLIQSDADDHHDVNNHEYPHDHLFKEEDYEDDHSVKPSEDKPKTTENSQKGNKDSTDSCPIKIPPHCNSMNTSSPSLKLDTSNFTPEQKTPIPPSPDTPDPSAAKSLPAFVTPTPPMKGSQCCAKFSSGPSSSSSTDSIIKNANKYDESPSPCAACKKYQESKKQNTGSTPSDSQPEIIKCPHKLKRLKEECQGYD